MIRSATRSRQPACQAWSRDKLLRESTIALGQAIDLSTLKSYGSALNSYLAFVRMHDLLVDPTPDTLSFTRFTCVTTFHRILSLLIYLACAISLSHIFQTSVLSATLLLWNTLSKVANDSRELQQKEKGL